MKFYIAYGSNLNLEHMSRCCPNAKILGSSILYDYALLFRARNTNENSYLTIEPCLGATVPVAIWQVDELDELALDDYEDYPELYYKKNIKLDVYTTASTIENVDCFVYIMYEDKPVTLPSDDYLEICLAGYKDFSFNNSKIYEALDRSKTLL